MNQPEKPEANPERHAPGDRLSHLSDAMLHINESLDFDTALQEVLGTNTARPFHSWKPACRDLFISISCTPIRTLVCIGSSFY